MKILSPAKINLCLDVLKKTSSGCHEIKTIFKVNYTFCDEIKIYTSKNKDTLSIVQGAQKKDAESIIKLHDNLAYKALLLLKKTYKIKKFVRIEIAKNIPISSGLGGASSNAAAVLKGLNKFWGLNLSQKTLLSLATKLGSDVPFFIVGGTAFGTHFGEKLKPLKDIKCIKFKINPQNTWPKLPKKIIKNPSKKTASMYANLDLSKCGKSTQKTRKLLAGVQKGDKKLILKNLHNDFETLIKVKHGRRLSGSGPATFNAS